MSRTLVATSLLVATSFLAGCSASEARPASSAAATDETQSVEPSGDQAPALQDRVTEFLAVPSREHAKSLVRVLAASNDEDHVVWLVDLLRFDVSTSVSREIGVALEEITGIESTSRIPNLVTYGSWAQSRALDGGDGYRDFKSSLYSRINPEFGPLLESVADPVELAGIQFGGVPLGGIPELNDPERVPAAAADWMVDDEIVLGVISNGEAVAYPLRILAHHEVANDTIGGDQLAIVYCTLCRSALVFERAVAGRTLTFLTSGLLLNSNKIMYDVETGSLWHHLRGLAIGGDLVGTELQLRSVNHMRWSDWVAENPDTSVLTLPKATFFDDPERPPLAFDYRPGEAYRSYYQDEDLWFPVLDTPETFALKTEVVGITRNGDSVAFDVAAFNAMGGSVQIEVGGDTLTVEQTGAGVRVFDPAGERVLTEQSFWFAWYGNHPDTRTLDF